VESSFKPALYVQRSMLVQESSDSLIVGSKRQVFLLMVRRRSYYLICSGYVIKSRNGTPVDETITGIAFCPLSRKIRIGLERCRFHRTFAHRYAGVAECTPLRLEDLFQPALWNGLCGSSCGEWECSIQHCSLTAVLAGLISTGNKILLVRCPGRGSSES